MTDTPAPYGYCPVCGGLGLSLERRPNGDARCENGHLYRPVGPSVTPLKVGRLSSLSANCNLCRPCWEALPRCVCGHHMDAHDEGPCAVNHHEGATGPECECQGFEEGLVAALETGGGGA